MKKTPILAAALLGATLVSGLAACSSNSSDDDAKPKPSKSASSAPKAVTGTCVDGFMLLDASEIGTKKAATVTDPCETVSIVGADATITLGDVTNLYFEGDSNKVTAGAVTNTFFAGNKNALTHTGAAPTVDDQGTENTVTAK
ncbi:DUF3060 domain-containing protein [Frondihabitans cladoniiphilus]|uniref:DUF3060 family protein n=1 Tax=Frondihabitans cladoniiphilus TaxID=715785 RepID=A0ABP8W4F7_9MICO